MLTLEPEADAIATDTEQGCSLFGLLIVFAHEILVGAFTIRFQAHMPPKASAIEVAAGIFPPASPSWKET